MLDLLAESALRSIALGCVAWLGLKALRARNPRIEMIVWRVVLIASIAMPVLTQWIKVTIPTDAARSLPIVATYVPVAVSLPRPQTSEDPSARAAIPRDDAVRESRVRPDWRLMVTAVYAFVAGIMLIRMLMGLSLMWRIVRAAHPIDESWSAGADVRMSDVVRVPITFASTILLPSEALAWNERKLRAAFLHERSHVVHGDFYLLLAAGFHRALFWFNPFAWWLQTRLGDLAEAISDDAAIAGLDDRALYVDILLDVAKNARDMPAGLAMARRATVRRRVARILAMTGLSPKLHWRLHLQIVAMLVPVATLSAVTITRSAVSDAVALRLIALPAKEVASDPGAIGLDRYVGQFQVGMNLVLSVIRNGDDLLAQMTGQPKRRLVATRDHEFATEYGEMNIAFVTDGGEPATEIILSEPNSAPRRWARIDGTTAAEIEAHFEQRVAAAPDRFRDQVPKPGGGAVLRDVIEDLRRDSPDFAHMSKRLADSMRRRLPMFHASLAALGAVELIFFKGVGPGGYDIYGVKFVNGSAEFRIDLAADGTLADAAFRPFGDGSPGGVMDCAFEPNLKAVRDRVPIRLSLINRSGAEVRLFALNGAGRRVSRGMLENDVSIDMQIEVAHPLVVADETGLCREIILPGHATQAHVIEPPRPADAPIQALGQRTTPLAGSDDALQQYLDGIRRGAPDYGRMTPVAAATTRRFLPLQQAILSRLGAQRAMSFRGVTQAGNDIYTVQFANGSAEWQIGLVDQGHIASIVLGPQ